jgi:hypothetical protein
MSGEPTAFDAMKRLALPLMLLAATPVFAAPDCKTTAGDVAYQDQLLQKQSQEFATRYRDTNGPGAEGKQEYLERLDALIAALRRDIDGLRWLIGHHCGPAEEEPNAIKSVHDMESALIALLVRRMDARAAR